jgi:DNA-binding SARP family transcriptional activator
MNFQILGPLRVTDDAGTDLPLAGSKQAAVLAILLLHPNEIVSSDQLIEDLWGDDAPPGSAKTVQVHVSRLRRALGGAEGGPLVTRNGGYLLEVGRGELDSVHFAELVAEANSALAEGAHARASARVRDALELWRGEPLSDFAYASFAQGEIIRLEEMRLAAIEVRIEAELALGRHAELVAELQALVARYPVRERLRGQLMLALYRAGRQADALQVYRAGRRVLVDQLGIEPGAELRELERAILAQDASLAPAAPRRRAPRTPAEPGARGPFVGYERELSTLEELLEQTLEGAGALALVVGEPGIGKSRLTDELSAVARARGAAVLWGRCWEAGGAPAYWPWTQAIRAHIRDCEPDALRAQLGAGSAEIAELLPELRDVFPDVPAAELDGAEGSRFRVFEAIAAFLRRAAAAQPLVVVLDDLHAADEPTLLLLQFLAGALADAPVLIVGAYRDTELGAGDPARAMLAELGRAGNCVRVALGGLSADDTAHFVELSASVAPMPRLAAALHDVSRGNPLFVSELARLLAAEERLHELGGDEALLLPSGVGEVIARRLQRLSESCRRTLGLAAVVGREFDTALVEASGASKGEQLLGDLAEARAARVIEDVPGARGVMRFSHELVRDTIYDELGSVDRRRLHATVGDALERIHAGHLEPELARLAHHFAEALPAVSAEKAIDYLQRAGDAAAALLAYEEAIRLYGLAAEIGRASQAAPALRCDALIKLGEQLVLAGQIARAEAALDEAEAIAGDSADPSVGGRIAIARAQLDLFDACATGKERLEEVLALFQQLGDPAAEARAWWALRTWYQGIGQATAAGEAAQRTLECARRAGNRGLVSQAVIGLASSLVDGATPVSEARPRILALRQEATNARTASLLLIFLAQLEAMSGHVREARQLVVESRALIQEIESASDVVLAATCRRARLERWVGDFQAMEAVARAGCEQLERDGFISYLRSDLVDVVDALIEQGRLDEAAAELARAEAMYNDEDVDAIQRQARARARLEVARGDVQAAERSAEIALEYVYKMDFPYEHAETWLVVAEVRRAAGREADARVAAENALAIAEAKEHVPFSERARALLATLEPVGAAG